MARAIHTFDNGVRVFEDQLWEGQRARYRKRNVHEAEEEDIFVDLIRRMPRNGCYVDVGAAIGYYLILARKLAPHLEIHGVEPLERHWHLLRENLALNDLVVVLREVAASMSAGDERTTLERAADQMQDVLSTTAAGLVLAGIKAKLGLP